MIISIDLDNVIRDQIGSIIAATRVHYNARLTRSDFNTWDPPLGHLAGVSDEEFTAWAWTDPMVFALSKPLPGAAQILRRLSRKHKIIINTSTAWPILTQPWLDRWKIPYTEIVHTTDKGGVEFDWHVDDSPKTLLALSEAGRQVVRFALPWNAKLSGMPTMQGWSR